jgi:cell division protein FtsI (penicillin-binding protein 3)
MGTGSGFGKNGRMIGRPHFTAGLPGQVMETSLAPLLRNSRKKGPPSPFALSKSQERLAILGLVLGVWLLALLLRLIQLQVFSHDQYARMATRQQEKLDPIEAPRGAIFDRNGNYLAISSEAPIVCVDPLRIPDKDTAASLLAGVLNLDKDELLDQILHAAATRRGYLIIDNRATAEEVEAIRKMNLEWVDIRRGSARSYPDGQLAAHVIGNVDAEGRGVAGIEKKLNSVLTGAPGLVRVTTDVHRQGYELEVEKPPVVGKDVKLTIDSRLQYVAERAIAEAVTEKHAQRGSIVAMDPYTGEVLALANYPTYNPNDRLKRGQRPYGREDYAVVAPFEPGSVFKVITLSAALETTRLRPASIIDCGNGILRLGIRTIHDEHRYGALPMEDVLAHSSNIGAIHIGLQVGENNMFNYVRKFGFGQKTGIELPAEAPGMLRPLSRWRSGSLPSISMGHEVSVTSVQLARAASVIANGGFLVQPHVVMWEQAPGGPKVSLLHPKPVQVLEPATVITMRQMMERVVLLGTGTKAHVLGYSTAGKTGTAQIFDFGRRVYTHNYNASFMGFSPVVHPSIVVVATVSGASGFTGMAAEAAAPAFRTVMEEALRLEGVPRDIPEELEAAAPKTKSGQAEDGKAKHEKQAEEDDLSIAALSDPPSREDQRAALGEDSEDGAVAWMPAAEVSAPKTPDFLGKTVQDVVEEAVEQGIQIEAIGKGLARVQRPAPGELLPPAAHVRVLFAR